MAGELVGQSDVERLALASMPVAGGVDIETLTKRAPEPFFVYVRAARAGKSMSTVNGKPRNWSATAVNRIVEALPLYGYRGHPDPEQFKRQRTWRDFVTVWVAGKVVDGAVYLKGFVPATEKDFQELIQLTLAAGNPMQVSAFGNLLGRERESTWDVEDFEPLSVDWAPPGDAGFPDTDVLKVAGELIEDAETKGAGMEEELKKLREDVARIGGELKTTKESLAAVTTERDALKTQVATIGGELKGMKDAETRRLGDAVKAHRETLLAKLPETERELGGELLTGETVADLDKNFDVVVGKLKKSRPGMKVIGGETKEEKGSGEAEKDFAG